MMLHYVQYITTTGSTLCFHYFVSCRKTTAPYWCGEVLRLQRPGCRCKCAPTVCATLQPWLVVDAGLVSPCLFLFNLLLCLCEVSMKGAAFCRDFGYSCPLRALTND